MPSIGKQLNAGPRSNGEEREARLGSWKEIAIYFRRDVRTVQRWERTEGLPVKRIFHRRGSSVYAFTSELDVWLASRSPSQARSIDDKKYSSGANMPGQIILVARGAKRSAVESNSESKSRTIASSDPDPSNSGEGRGLVANGKRPVDRADSPPQVVTRRAIRMSFFVACQQFGRRGAFGHFQEIRRSRRISTFADLPLCSSGPLGEGVGEKEQQDELPN
jgi:hypothetical protein